MGEWEGLFCEWPCWAWLRQLLCRISIGGGWGVEDALIVDGKGCLSVEGRVC